MSEFIPPEDAVIEEQITEQINFIPPTDAKQEPLDAAAEKPIVVAEDAATVATEKEVAAGWRKAAAFTDEWLKRDS